MGTKITFRRPDGKQAGGYLAKAGRANAPGIVVIEEWWGLQDQIRGIWMLGFWATHLGGR